MKCTTIQRSLALSEDPALPTLVVREHLTHCAGCRQYQQQLLEIDQQTRALPTPHQPMPAGLLEQILTGSDSSRAAKPRGRAFRERGIRKLAAAAALAAGLLFFAVGSWVWQQQKLDAPTQKWALRRDPLVRKLTTTYPQIVKEKQSIPDRLHALTEVADSLLKALRDTEDVEPRALCRLYEEIVRDGIPHQAKLLPVGERSEVLLPIVSRLAVVESEADRLAELHTGVEAWPYRELVTATREGRRRLQDLLGETPTLGT